VEYHLLLFQEFLFSFTFVADFFSPCMIALVDRSVLDVNPFGFLIAFNLNPKLISVGPML
jgi:hypothetical protein